MRFRERTVSERPQDSQAARWSLLARLKNLEDEESWRKFFDTWRLIYRLIRKNHDSQVFGSNLLALNSVCLQISQAYNV